MENISKLIILGLMATLFATAVMFTLSMYSSVLDIDKLIQDKSYIRGVMEVIYE